MAFEQLKEQLRDQWADLSSKIQENSTFNNIREKFQAQSPNAQRGILAGIAVFVVLVILSFPYSYISTSNEYLATFQENRELIQGLLRASRTVNEPSPLPPAQSTEMLKDRVSGILREARLLPEQIGETAVLPGQPAKDLTPKVVQQAGIAVQVKRLNLTQIVNISHALQSLGPGTKLMGLDIVQTAGQTHYYDIVARIVNFSLPDLKRMDTSAEDRGAKKRPVRPRPKSDEEAE